MTSLRTGLFLLFERSGNVVQKKLPLINSAHGSETRNIINEIIKAINDRGLEILSESAFLNWLDENGVKHLGEWDDTKEYDRLSVVLHEGNSYTSKKRVPVGIDILNEEFWVVTGNFNAQLDKTEKATTFNTLKISQKGTEGVGIAVPKTIVTFIDDDGASTVLTHLKPMFTSKGKPCVTAVYSTSNILRDEQSRAELRDLQDNHNWEVASHTFNHINLGQATKQEIEDDSIAFHSLMGKYGFNVKSLVYPWGSQGDTTVVSKYYNAGILAAPGVYGGNKVDIDDYTIYRESLGDGTSTTDYLKGIIDNAENDPRWIVFMMHSNDNADFQQIETILNYVIAKDIPVMNIQDALQYYGSMVNTRNNATSSDDTRYTRIKPNGKIFSNRYLLNFYDTGNSEVEITAETPPSQFDLGITYRSLFSARTGNFPSNGTLITIKSGDLNVRDVKQFIITNTNNDLSPLSIYVRSGLTTGDEWSDWNTIQGRHHTTINETDTRDDLPKNQFVAQVQGWSVGSGFVETYNQFARGYSRQVFYRYNRTDIHTRHETSGGGWSDWVQL